MKKILLLRFSSIGDIVLTTPVVRCLKQQLGAEVHYLTKQVFAPLLTGNPYVNRVFSFNMEVQEVLNALAQERYDWVIDLHHNLRSARVKWALRRPARSFDKLNLQKWLLVHTGIDCLPDKHVVDRYMDTVRHLGVQYDGEGLDYFIPEAAELHLPDLRADLQAGAYVVFAIGANHATKRLPQEKIVEVCRRTGSPVVLLGGKAEMESGRQIADQAGTHVLNCCGQLSVHQSASAIRQAAKVITHDTGMMHIAAAFQKEIVSVWGNTVPKFGMYPFYRTGIQRNTTVESHDLPCRPCSKIGYAQCPKGHFKCMQDIPAAVILQALK
ncbi:MAG: glycosyltransferase family 9 protein [Saprospirales bacterium]|nr:glycosyltransferase family 9 protein [Saprospirales bacterium]